MPRISSFYGIVIWMYFDEPQHEGRPHFHATYGDDEASFDIDNLELIAGGLPRRAQKLVTEWARASRGAAGELESGSRAPAATPD
jgi:hypothetical protein